MAYYYIALFLERYVGYNMFKVTLIYSGKVGYV